MTALASLPVHQAGCPETSVGGAKGPCLCRAGHDLTRRYPAAMRPQPPARVTDVPRRVGEAYRAPALRGKPTISDRKDASTQLAIAGKRWMDAFTWAQATGREGAGQLRRSSLHVPTALAYLEHLRASTTTTTREEQP
jgi:hypothetical protein